MSKNTILAGSATYYARYGARFSDILPNDKKAFNLPVEPVWFPVVV